MTERALGYRAVAALGLLICGCSGPGTVTGPGSKPVNRYRYYETDVRHLPPIGNIEGIMITAYHHPEVWDVMAIIGDRNKIERVAGHEILADRVIEDPEWVRRIVDDIRRARRSDRGTASDARIVLLTRQRAYMIQWDADDEERVVYNTDFASSDLWETLHELGVVQTYEHRPPGTERRPAPRRSPGPFRPN